MERVIYCPSAAELQEAEDLAKETLLPILLGESKMSSLLEFDRKKVGVLKIPHIKNVVIGMPEVRAGMHQTVIVTDEFCSNMESYSVFVDTLKIQPQYTEKYTKKWCFTCTAPGTATVTIMMENEKVSELNFYVC